MDLPQIIWFCLTMPEPGVVSLEVVGMLAYAQVFILHANICVSIGVKA